MFFMFNSTVDWFRLATTAVYVDKLATKVIFTTITINKNVKKISAQMKFIPVAKFQKKPLQNLMPISAK